MEGLVSLVVEVHGIEINSDVLKSFVDATRN